MTASLLSMIGRISSLPLPNYNKERKRKEKDKTQKISFSYKIYLMNWQRGKWVSRFYFIRPTFKSAKPKTHKYFSILMHCFTRVCHLKTFFIQHINLQEKWWHFLVTLAKLAVPRMCPLPWMNGIIPVLWKRGRKQFNRYSRRFNCYIQNKRYLF